MPAVLVQKLDVKREKSYQDYADQERQSGDSCTEPSLCALVPGRSAPFKKPV